MQITAQKTTRFAAILSAFLFAAVLPPCASAQQVTYYDFDTPWNQDQASWNCSPSSASNPLFCFNDATGLNASPSFLSDFFPASIDPSGGSGSNHFAVQLTPAAAVQASSLWFSVPQKVSSGFTAWFVFKITPAPGSFATADGFAFVIQNAHGSEPADPATGCTETGAGPTVVGGGGGCIGYGGIDNSLALEFDTYRNTWDPSDGLGPDNDNHISLQNCGAGLPNSPDHNPFSASGASLNCQASLVSPSGSTPAFVSNPQSSTPGAGAVTLADGNVHQVVVVYSGPSEPTPNLLQVYIDPPYVPGTHTPAAGAVPVLSGAYDLASALSLINSGSAADSAYIGFTSGTGAAFEQHELMAWTFTPHTAVTQQQPLNPPGTPTVFPYGSHDYTVNYPADGPSTSGISMVVTASTLAPATFSSLIGPTQFAGSQCQVYDDTGGNCIVYSVSCVQTATGQPVACPSTAGDSSSTIDVTSSYDNSLQPVSPGFLQGDPFYTLIGSISASGSTATVTCPGECSVTPGQTVTIFGAQPASFDGAVQVASVIDSSQFTFTTGLSGSTTTGGYLTSANVRNIFYSYSPSTDIDGTSAGRAHSFSDFIVTSLTTVASQTQLSAAGPATVGAADVLTATITAPSSQVPGPGSMPTGTNPPIAPSTVTFSAGSAETPIPGCVAVPVVATSATTGTARCSYTPSASGSVTITAQYTDAYHQPSSASLSLSVQPPYDAAISAHYGSTDLVYPASTGVTVCVASQSRFPATGLVRIDDGASPLVTLFLLPNGCAWWYFLPPLPAGAHVLTVSYSGDRNNPAGVSAPTTLTVKPAPVSLSAVCRSAVLRAGSSYQCSVSALTPAGPAQGVVTWQLDGATPATLPLFRGTAQIVIPHPALGQHTLSLWYTAQSNDAAAGPRTESFTVEP